MVKPGDPSSRLDLAALPSAPGHARRHVRATLGAWGLDGETAQSAEILTSELVTNAVQASQRGARVGLALRLPPGQVVVEVTDADPRPPVIAHAGPDAEAGRGLMLVQALSLKWWSERRPGGKAVLAVLAAPEWRGNETAPR